MGGADALLLRAEVEAFLVEEAAMLDEWRLDEWLGLFTEGGRYLIPTTDARDVDPRAGVTIVDDDTERLAGRVRRLTGSSPGPGFVTWSPTSVCGRPRFRRMDPFL
jgi:3-phenylpropionate/cinnamic acid dioxygenase small subunit